MYNEDAKTKYLKYLENAKQNKFLFPSRKMFSDSLEFEEQYGKDLAYFNKDEILIFYKSLSPQTYDAVRRNILHCNKYIKWYRDTLDASVKVVRLTAEEGDSCITIPRSSWQFYSKETIFNIMDKCFLKSSALLIWTLYIGLRGTFMDEISLLEIDDILESENQIIVHRFDFENKNVYFSRKISVPDDYIKLAKAVHDEQFYYQSDGRMSGRLEDSRFIFKRREGTKDKTIEENIINRARLYREKLQRVSNSKDMILKDFNPKSIYNSGMMNYLFECMEVLGLNEQDVLNDKNSYIIDRVCERYGAEKEHAMNVIKEYFEK